MIKLLIVCLFVTTTVFAQKKQASYDKFLFDVGHNIHVDKPLMDECKWQYALIKVDCSSSNKVIKYTFLNPVAPDIKSRFVVLNNYQLDKTIPIKRRPIIFCMTFENHSSDCILNNKAVAVEGVKEVYELMAKQITNFPNSIVIEKIQQIRYNFDPER